MSISTLLSEVSNEDLKLAIDFCKLEPGMEDDLVRMWLLAARKETISEVGDSIDTFYDDNPVFKQVCLIKVFNHFNNRDTTSTSFLSYNRIEQDDINALKDEYRYELELLT